MNLFNWQDSYPNSPGFRKVQPSIDGAARVKPMVKSQYSDIIHQLKIRPMIAEELMAATGISKNGTMAGRLTELTLKGIIKKAPYKRMSSAKVMVTVWEVV